MILIIIGRRLRSRESGVPTRGARPNLRSQGSEPHSTQTTYKRNLGDDSIPTEGSPFLASLILPPQALIMMYQVYFHSEERPRTEDGDPLESEHVEGVTGGDHGEVEDAEPHRLI